MGPMYKAGGLSTRHRACQGCTNCTWLHGLWKGPSRHNFLTNSYPRRAHFDTGTSTPTEKMNDRPILTPVLAPGRPGPKPLSHGFPLAFDTGSNGMQNIEAIYDVTHDP